MTLDHVFETFSVTIATVSLFLFMWRHIGAALGVSSRKEKKKGKQARLHNEKRSRLTKTLARWAKVGVIQVPFKRFWLSVQTEQERGALWRNTSRGGLWVGTVKSS